MNVSRETLLERAQLKGAETGRFFAKNPGPRPNISIDRAAHGHLRGLSIADTALEDELVATFTQAAIEAFVSIDEPILWGGRR